MFDVSKKEMYYILITKDLMEVDFNGECNRISTKFPGCIIFMNESMKGSITLAAVPLTEIRMILTNDTYKNLLKNDQTN